MAKEEEKKELTKAEEEVMRILWKKEKAFVKDILKDMGEPAPAYNTVSTIIRILEKKGFVGHKAYGKAYRYFPLIPEKDYKRSTLRRMKERLFGGSYENLLSFLIKEESLSGEDVEEIEQLIGEMRKDGRTNKKGS